MATRTLVELIDDLDGGPASQTILFALDSNAYAIDLSDVNAKQLRADLERYIAAARKTRDTGWRVRGAGAVKPPSTGGLSGRDQRRQVREWANSNGFHVGNRGRVPEQVMAAYERAHG